MNVVKKTIICCLVFLLIIFGADWIRRSTAPKQTQVYSLSDYSYAELESGTIYQAYGLTVVDSFAQNNHTVNGVTTNTTDFYLVTFRDENNRLVAAILSVDDDDDISSQLSYYTIDERQYIGDCVVNGYVATRENTNAELAQYFNEALNKYSPILNEYTVTPQWMLVYHCNASEDPLKK